MKPVSEMTDLEKAQVRAWIKNWQELGPILENLRWKEIREADTARSVEVLGDAFDHAVTSQPPRKSSGLVEQQEYFSRARR